MISLARLRAHTRLPASEQAELVAVRDEVIEMFENLTGFLWKKRTGQVDAFSPPENSWQVLLSLVPVIRITKVEEKQPSDATWAELAADTEYETEGDRQVRKIGAPFLRRVRVTYDGGYDESSCPQDIQRALLTQASFIIQRTSDTKITVESEGFQRSHTQFLDPRYHPIFREIAGQRQRKI